MKNLLRLSKINPWSVTQTATPWAQKALAAVYLRQLRLNLLLQWPAMGMVLALLWGHFPLWQIGLWGGCFALALSSAHYRYTKNIGKILSIARATRILAQAPKRVLVIASLWGSTVIFMPPMPPSHQIALALIAMGHGFAASSRLSSIPRGALLFQLTVCLPYISYYLFDLMMLSLPALFVCLGIIAGLFAMAQSVNTGHRQLMMALRAAHEAERAVEKLEQTCDQWAEINETAEAVALFDTQQGLLLWNEAYARLLGLPRDVLRAGLHWEDIAKLGGRDLFAAPEDDYADGSVAWPSDPAAPTGTMAQCLCQVDHLWVRSTARRINAHRYSVSHVDITALKDREMKLIRLQEELLSARDAAQSASSAKSRFLANMSHEIRTPLNAVIGFADLMMHAHRKGEMASAQHLEYLQLIHDSGQHLLDIVEDILDLALVESGRIQLVESQTDIVELVRQSARIAIGRHMDVSIHLVDDLPRMPLWMWIDARLVRQAVINIVSNSVKFSPHEGRIWLALDMHAQGLRILIRDEGAGIAESKIAHVLEPFAQGDASDSRRFGGLGLGLPLARQFMEAHGGQLHLHSKEGQGTMVTLSLPAARQYPAPFPQLPASAPRSRHHSQRQMA